MTMLAPKNKPIAVLRTFPEGHMRYEEITPEKEDIDIRVFGEEEQITIIDPDHVLGLIRVKVKEPEWLH